MNTEQEKFWSNKFGSDYSERNSWQSDLDWDNYYREFWGSTKLEINDFVLKDTPRDIKILEVGCNIGMQLRGFQRMGFHNLYGIELQSYAVEKSKQIQKGINIIQGSAFDIPFKDCYFDLVCTNGVLIHIAPNDHKDFMKEVVRCSSRFIMGWEYFAETTTEIEYRGNKGYLWKADFAKIYTNFFPELKLEKRKKVVYISGANKGLTDEIFLLSK